MISQTTFLTKSKIQSILILFLSFIITACGGGSDDVVLQSLTISAPSTTIAAGLTQQFTVSANYSDGTSQVIATPGWSSSDTTIATVSPTGLVTTLKPGNAVIAITFNGVSTSKTLTVTAAVLQSITVASTSTSIAAGLTQQLTASGVYSDGTSQAITTPTWNSSDTTVATVNAAGLVTSLKITDCP